MRSITIDIDGESYNIDATWGAALAITDAVADPMTLMMDLMQNGVASQSARFDWGFVMIAKVIHAAMKANGHKLKVDEIGQALMEMGMIETSNIVLAVLKEITMNGSKEVKGSKTSGK